VYIFPLEISSYEGILPVCKPKAKTSFSLIGVLRQLTQIRTIGHAGTLDPFADGVMILLIGKRFTQLSDRFLNQDKEYLASVYLGITTDTYDIEGKVTMQSLSVPTLDEIQQALLKYQGTILQTPPMFSAKKVEGKKLYELARKGITIERKAVPVTLQCALIEYSYPHLILKVQCSKGTYLRSLAYDLGVELGCGAHLSALTRTRSGTFTLNDCCDGARLIESGYDWVKYVRKLLPNRPLA
jgi:tRNA pseudouridine55 synthase